MDLRYCGIRKVQLLSRLLVNNVEFEEDDTIWRFTSFYGEPDNFKRRITWDLLKRLGAMSSREWLVMGDFNETLQHGKKWGVHQHWSRDCMIFGRR